MRIYLLWLPNYAPNLNGLLIDPQLIGIWTDWQKLREHVGGWDVLIPVGQTPPYIETWQRGDDGRLNLHATTHCAVTLVLDTAEASDQSNGEA